MKEQKRINISRAEWKRVPTADHFALHHCTCGCGQTALVLLAQGKPIAKADMCANAMSFLSEELAVQTARVTKPKVVA